MPTAPLRVTSPKTHLLRNAGLLLAMLLAQALLLLNPGYFSHDELQWGAAADVAGWTQLPWMGWLDWGTFQYRPLTFNLWLLLSHGVFERPMLFHAAWVLFGSINGLLLACVLRHAGATWQVAAAGALVFVLNPHAAYVHGWVATLADLLWTGLALALTAWLQGRARRECEANSSIGAVDISYATTRDAGRSNVTALVACVVTALALLAKESAIVLPGLALLAALWCVGRRTWWVAAAGSGAAVALYLALRLAPLIHGAGTDSHYGWSLLRVPQRWLEYQGYLWLPTLFEIQSIGQAWMPVLLALACTALLVLWALWRAHPRLAGAWVLGSAVALGPVLILAQSANQYGYGWSALACGLLALAWMRSTGLGRGVIAFACLLLVCHGIVVQRVMLDAGQKQSRFSPAVAHALQTHETLVLAVDDARDRWLYLRLTHDIPQYRGGALGTRVRLGAPGEPATWRVAPDGTLIATPEH